MAFLGAATDLLGQIAPPGSNPSEDELALARKKKLAQQSQQQPRMPGGYGAAQSLGFMNKNGNLF